MDIRRTSRFHRMPDQTWYELEENLGGSEGKDFYSNQKSRLEIL